MWAQIKHLQRNGWVETQVHRPYVAFESVLIDALQHTLPEINPPSHNEDSVYPLPRVVFRMFDYTDVPDVSTGRFELIDHVTPHLTFAFWGFTPVSDLWNQPTIKRVMSRSRVDTLLELCSPLLKGGNSAYIAVIASSFRKANKWPK